MAQNEYELSSKQQAINKMRSKLPRAITDEQKRKEVEEKQRQVQQLEQELGLGGRVEKGHDSARRSQGKDKTYNLLDIKEAVEIKPSDYSKSINTKEFQFVQKPRDGTANYTLPEPTRKKHGKGLRTKYDLV